MESDEQTEIGGIPVKVSSHRVMDQYAPFNSADVYKRQQSPTQSRWTTNFSFGIEPSISLAYMKTAC